MDPLHKHALSAHDHGHVCEQGRVLTLITSEQPGSLTAYAKQAKCGQLASAKLRHQYGLRTMQLVRKAAARAVIVDASAAVDVFCIARKPKCIKDGAHVRHKVRSARQRGALPDVALQATRRRTLPASCGSRLCTAILVCLLSSPRRLSRAANSAGRDTQLYASSTRHARQSCIELERDACSRHPYIHS